MFRFKQFLTDLTAFHHKYKTVTPIVWLAAALASFSLIWSYFPAYDIDDWRGVMIFIMIPLIAAPLFYVLTQYDKTFGKRISVTNGGPVWQVKINDITVGEMKDADYAAIQRMVFFDTRLYIAQLFNFGKIATQMVGRLFNAIPLCIFWIAVGCFFFAPDSFNQTLDFIQTVTPTQAISFVPVVVKLLVMASILTLGVQIVLGHCIGFVNQFEQARNTRVRRALACAANGEVSLCRTDNGSLIIA